MSGLVIHVTTPLLLSCHPYYQALVRVSTIFLSVFSVHNNMSMANGIAKETMSQHLTGGHRKVKEKFSQDSNQISPTLPLS